MALLSFLFLAYHQKKRILYVPVSLMIIINTILLFCESPNQLFYLPTCGGQYQFDKMGFIFSIYSHVFQALCTLTLIVFRFYPLAVYSTLLLATRVYEEILFNDLVCSSGKCYDERIMCRD